MWHDWKANRDLAVEGLYHFWGFFKNQRFLIISLFMKFLNHSITAFFLCNFLHSHCVYNIAVFKQASQFLILRTQALFLNCETKKDWLNLQIYTRLNFQVRQVIQKTNYWSDFKAFEVFCHVGETFYFFCLISRKYEIK